jgi:Na+-translocating ferredoxin:NAD+ oxidoreductase subunit E
MNQSKWSVFTRGIIRENPVLVMLLGLCPTLAVTTSAFNGFGMGISATFVLICSNFVVSIAKDLIPNKIRIPCFIVIIASFVTLVDILLSAYLPDLHKQLGIFIPLIVVNCVILARAEAFASKTKFSLSMIDGLGMGIGFTLALVILGSVRELLGAGTIFGLTITAGTVLPVLIMIMPPGAFIALGFILATVKKIEARRA